jgi:hypothetical protein
VALAVMVALRGAVVQQPAECYTTLMRLGVLLVSMAGLALPGCCSSPVGGRLPATIYLEPPITDPGIYEFELTANGTTNTCQAQLWIPPQAGQVGQAGAGGASSFSQVPDPIARYCAPDQGGCVACDESGGFLLPDLEQSGDRRMVSKLYLDTRPERAQVTITRTDDGAVLFDGEVEFTYETEYPNGRGCGANRYGEATVELDQP